MDMDYQTEPPVACKPRVDHTYRDFSRLSEANMAQGNGHFVSRRTAEPSPHDHFPIRLHYVLDTAEERGFAKIISWQPHGRSFKVHKQKRFVEEVMPKWFKQTQYASFQRQLSFYGFKRITVGRDASGYYHELFLEGPQYRHLAKCIERARRKNEGPRKPSSPQHEPDFYAMEPLPHKRTSLYASQGQTTASIVPVQVTSQSDSLGEALGQNGMAAQPVVAQVLVPMRVAASSFGPGTMQQLTQHSPWVPRLALQNPLLNPILAQPYHAQVTALVALQHAPPVVPAPSTPGASTGSTEEPKDRGRQACKGSSTHLAFLSQQEQLIGMKNGYGSSRGAQESSCATTATMSSARGRVVVTQSPRQQECSLMARENQLPSMTQSVVQSQMQQSVNQQCQPQKNSHFPLEQPPRLYAPTEARISSLSAPAFHDSYSAQRFVQQIVAASTTDFGGNSSNLSATTTAVASSSANADEVESMNTAAQLDSTQNIDFLENFPDFIDDIF